MSKIQTPAMVKINKKRKGQKYGQTPLKGAWHRLVRNKMSVVGMVIIVLLLLMAIFANFIAPYSYQQQDYTAIAQGPSPAHIFGTDNMGRDIFSRCVYGARWSLPIGLLCVVAGLALGGTFGVLAGFCGGKIDNVIMRIMDIFQAIPAILMAIAVVAVLGNGIIQLVVAMSIAFMPNVAKTCRAAIFTVKGSEYVDASRAIGVSQFKIIIRHLVPNAIGVIVIDTVGMVGAAILMVSTLSYIGVGIVPPTPEWGAILSAGKEYIRSGVHMVLFPGLMIMLTVISFNLFGDGLRDALDPRLK
ncbi:MAG TPA: ABC transporter permease [Candidatus Scybalocola faecavium]|uniref:ABC transporter permease n=1 Tax=Candidatus Scybalocola faecigallinarum TaxID=2840941 RepID=A0A9D1JQU6_9FIRM|nr:ABC transporter permease [Candidatus Scybalocola faecavium]HIS46680.1 ABC transporter permease [Candidatus Scybalocola faecigallinarum]